jgi:hypothetical protein
VSKFTLVAVTASGAEFELDVHAETLKDAKAIAAGVWGGCKIKRKTAASPSAKALGKLVGM